MSSLPLNRIGAHLLAWLLFISLMASFLLTVAGGTTALSTHLLSGAFLLFCAVYIGLFYLNMHLLIPKLYLPQRYVGYVSAIVLLFLIVLVLQPFDRILQGAHAAGPAPRPFPEATFPDGRPPAGPRGRPSHIDIVSIVLFVMVVAVSLALQIVRQWRTTQRQAAQAQVDRAQAELSFLKAQINPHFLFNTLNNIYTLSVTQSPHAPEAILKLSGIMRYVTDEVQADRVPLEWEVDCISHYIDLQRLRLNEKTDLDFSVTGDVRRKEIAPLVLMTFIENVFKYGISSHEPSTVTIRIFAEEKTITFFCQNRVFSTQQPLERTGIGIANTRKRLDYLYPNQYLLHIDAENGLFTVQLTLQA